VSVLLVQMSFPSLDGVVKNGVANTFHFGTDGTDDDTDANLVADGVADFYRINGGGTTLPLRQWMAGHIDTHHARARVYRLNDAEPRIPIHDETYDLGANGGDGLPSEVALVMSFKAAPVSGENPRNRRNRIYFGPLREACTDLGANQIIRPIATLKEALRSAGERMLTIFGGGGGSPSWIVYSPTLGLTNTRAVASGWVDDAFDIQRRRGVQPTSRVTF